jgi:hypothetical protein
LPNPAHTYSANGVYSAVLTVRDGLGGVDASSPVVVTVGNLPPSLTISSPQPGTLFEVGEPIVFSGSANDPEEGALPSQELHWRVHLHHLNHVHPVILDHVGASGSFIAEDHGENPNDLFYRIYLWAEDSTGLQSERFVDVGHDPTSATRIYSVSANNRDATSVVNEVRISGYSPAEPYDFVGADNDQESSAAEFQVDVPDGATIDEARLIVVAGPVQNNSPTGALKIHLYNVDDAAPFQNGPFGDLVNHHPTYPIALDWAAGSSWVPGQTYESPDLAFLVHIWINRAGYSPGKHIGFVVTEGSIQTGRYYGWADFAAPEEAPKLRIRYTYATSAPQMPSSSRVLLYPARPNPSSATATMAFSITNAGPVRLSIYDMGGRLVTTLVDGWRAAGMHHATWDGRTNENAVSSGIYFLRLEGNGESATQRLVRVK